MKFSNLNIGSRLALGFAVVLLGALLLAATGWYGIHRESQVVATALSVDAKFSGAIRNISTEVQTLRRYEKDMLFSAAAQEMLGVSSLEKIKEYKQKWDATRRDIDKLLADARATAVIDEERRRLDLFAAEFKRYDAGIEQVYAGLVTGQIATPEAGYKKVNEFRREIRNTEDVTQALLESASKRIEAIGPAIVRIVREVVMVLGITSLAVVVVAILISVFISRSITLPVREAVRVAEALAKGDLDQKIEVRSKDETGRLMLALQGTVGQLAAMVGRIKDSSDMVNTASREIAQGNSDLSSRTEEQASALEETSASMQQMTATVSQNAENAKKANELAAQASGVAVKGGEAVRDVVGTMNGITESSKKIADIIGVIDGIAFQTNILALNAAVEAARAGEQGRGFAVVASEVRSLAQRSAAAAKEIKDLITDSVSKVDAGSRQVNDAGRTMEEVVVSVKKVTSLIAEITAASQEQAQGIEQVSETMTQMEKVTQQNAAMVEEASAAAGSLEEQAQALSSAVAVFQLGDEARRAAVAKPVIAKPAVSNVVTLAKRAVPEAKKSKPQPHVAAPKVAVGGKGKPAQEEGWQEF